jgi:hypothetical protein
MPNFVDLTGRTFVRLTVLRRSERVSGARRKPMWSCRCQCGTVLDVIGDNLRSGCSKSCGCLDRQKALQRFTKHGAARVDLKTVEYQTWKRMKQRCLNPNNPKYHRYGGRGIQVCQEWVNDFPRFLADMGQRPKGCSIDRINNDGNYEPSNCRWATIDQQAANKSRNGPIPRCHATASSGLGGRFNL